MRGPYYVDEDGRENRSRHGRAVLRIFVAPNELVVVRLEEKAEGREDDDGKDGDDDTIKCQRRASCDVARDGETHTKTMLAWHSREASWWRLAGVERPNRCDTGLMVIFEYLMRRALNRGCWPMRGVYVVVAA